VIDETNGIIGWPIVQQYRERAWGDYARIAELRQSTDHWHDTAQMLKRQRDIAEEERDGWKIRAMKAEQGRQVNRDLLIIAEGQRDQAKIDAEHWKGEWAVAMGQLCGARAEVEAMRELAKTECDSNDALRNIILWALGENGEFPERPVESCHNYQFYWWRKEMRSRLDAAMAVQPTTGGGDE